MRKLRKRWHRAVMGVMDALDAGCMNVIDWAGRHRKKAFKRWNELGGAYR